MAERTYFSKHIPKTSMSNADVKAVLSDISLFNRVKWKAASMEEVRRKAGRHRQGGPDLRTKENTELRASLPVSAHVFLKKEFRANDYFVNSAVNAAKASLKSAEGLNKENITRLEQSLPEMKKKLASLKRRLGQLKAVKQGLINASREARGGKPYSLRLDSPIERYDPQTGMVHILCFGKTVRVYENPYLFEIRYVDPKIRTLASAVSSLEGRISRTQEKISALKADRPGVCFGTKKMFRRQDGPKYPDHETWLHAFRKARSNTLSISGRKDARQGNFCFRYDTVSHTLVYTAQGGRQVAFPHVMFPYGQESVDAAVLAAPDERSAVCWSVTETGGSFLVRCMVDVKASTRMNDDYSTGCVSMDANYDNISVSELDASGNILRHKVIPLSLEGCSSGRSEQGLSSALDRAFSWCDEAHKPFAMEDLSVKNKTSRYGSKTANRHISRFSYAIITRLAESKALKHDVAVIKVNPAYTSQTGKLLFVKKYGCSIHEAASAAIGRRAMGIQDRPPDCFRRMLTDKQKHLPRLSQWRALYKATKNICPADMYQYRFC